MSSFDFDFKPAIIGLLIIGALMGIGLWKLIAWLFTHLTWI